MFIVKALDSFDQSVSKSCEEKQQDNVEEQWKKRENMSGVW